MPMYDYKCNTCEHQFEKVLKIDDRDNPLSEPCPLCSNVSVSRMIATPAISYSNAGSMKNTESFKDRIREIKKKIPERYRDNLSNIV